MSKPTKPTYRTVYKVCAPGMRSAYLTPHALRYQRDRFVTAPSFIPGAKLFVFGKLADALTFMRKQPRTLTLWKARARNCIPLGRRLLLYEITSTLTPAITTAQMVAFWRGVPSGLITYNVPTGTLGAEAVKLVSVVKRKRCCLVER